MGCLYFIFLDKASDQPRVTSDRYYTLGALIINVFIVIIATIDLLNSSEQLAHNSAMSQIEKSSEVCFTVPLLYLKSTR